MENPDDYDRHMSARTLFAESNFDAYDSSTDRYQAVLREGSTQHGLSVTDVLAVTADLGLWAICRAGIFHATLRGLLKKRIEVGPFISYSEIAAMTEKPSGPKTMCLVMLGQQSQELARIDFSAGGMDNTPQIAAGHRERIREILQPLVTKP